MADRRAYDGKGPKVTRYEDGSMLKVTGSSRSAFDPDTKKWRPVANPSKAAIGGKPAKRRSVR